MSLTKVHGIKLDNNFKISMLHTLGTRYDNAKSTLI
jgi:hypothetical protein